MNEKLQYLKYCSVGILSTVPYMAWSEVLEKSGLAFLLGFLGAVGGFLAKLLTNWLKKKWPNLK